jgi:hypothetical protein
LSLQRRGGVEAFSFRVDDGAPKSRRAGGFDKEAGVVHLEGRDFQRVLSGKRLRLQVTTLLYARVDEDIDLNGLAEMYKILQGHNCKKSGAAGR